MVSLLLVLTLVREAYVRALVCRACHRVGDLHAAQTVDAGRNELAPLEQGIAECNDTRPVRIDGGKLGAARAPVLGRHAEDATLPAARDAASRDAPSAA